VADRPSRDGVDAELLDRFLAGECSEAEAALVRRHLMVRPQVARALAALLRQLDGEGARPPAPDSGASWEQLRRRMHGGESSAPAPAPMPTAHRPARGGRRPRFAALPAQAPSWPRAIAAAAVAAAIGAAVLYHGRRPADRATAAAEPPEQTFATVNRQRAELRLADGTRIRLAPASRLRVSGTYGATRRDVYLEGEGYFQVTHDPKRPFAVHAGAAVARDLGTEFAVRSYSGDRAVQVAVRSGLVAMSGVGQLGAGDVAQLGPDGTASLTHGVAVDSLLGWLHGRLVFHDAPLGEVLAELRRWHDVDVQLADSSLAALPFTGVLTDASFGESLDLVAATLGLRVRRRDGAVTLRRVGGLTPRATSTVAMRSPDRIR
jgi:transmembrane sensor